MKTRILLVLSFGLLAFSSCKLEYEDEKLQKEEDTKLKEYLAFSNITVPPTASGLYYVERTQGTGATPSDTDFVMVNTAWYLLSGKLVGSSDSAIAFKNNALPFVLYKGPVKYYLPYTLEGITEGILKMKEGGKATLIIPSKLAFGGYNTPSIPRYSSLRVEIELLRVIKDPIVDDLEHIRRYLDTLQLTEQDKTNGIYIKIDKEGTGDFIGDYDTVNLTYTSRALDTIYTLGNKAPKTAKYIGGEDDILPGLKAALKKLKNGSEARIIIPYDMAYGKAGQVHFYNESENSVKVPPFTSFYYTIVINDVGEL